MVIVLTVELFLQIFDMTTPISNYFQERSIDFIKAYRMYGYECNQIINGYIARI